MAQAISFPEADSVEKSRSGMFGDLPVKSFRDRSVSCWQLSRAEIEEISRSGVVWVVTTNMTRAMFDRNPDVDVLQTPLRVEGHKAAGLGS